MNIKNKEYVFLSTVDDMFFDVIYMNIFLEFLHKAVFSYWEDKSFIINVHNLLKRCLTSW